MKKIIPLFTFAFVFASASDAIPIHWDVELAAQPPQVFTLQRPRGETYELEAVLKNRGKPFEPAITNACIYWQTNGMENLYWSAPASVSNNFLLASWLPSMDPGATTVRGYIGDPGHIYAAAFQLRFIGSPGPDPVSIDLPVKVLDFSTVEVLHPPYYTKDECDDKIEAATNDAVRDAVSISKDYTDNAIVHAGSVTPEISTNIANSRISAMVPEWSRNPSKPSYTAEEVGAAPRATTYTKDEVDELVEDAGKVKTVAGQEPDDSGNVSLSPSTIGAASSEDVQTMNLGYQRLYSFSTGATNANISVTNYPPTAAEAEGRTHYDPNDPDLDFSTVPASMRLDEKRDGEKRTVVDTRDWPVWYFGCKLPRILAAAQEYAHTAYTNALAHLSAWADRTARGLENPAGESTLVIDVPNIWLMTDQTFEKHVSGSSSCWVIRSKNAAISPNVTTNGFLELTDAFGTPYIRFNKAEATFADPPASGIYHDDQEGEWIITYETTTKPKGGANLALQGSETYPGKAILKEEGDELCPAVITWTGSSGHWLMHAKPKQIAGADPGKMFFGAVVEVEGQDYIEYLKPVSFSHLVMPNGKKIAPDVPASASVGTIVNWKVVQ